LGVPLPHPVFSAAKLQPTTPLVWSMLIILIPNNFLLFTNDKGRAVFVFHTIDTLYKVISLMDDWLIKCV
jgi:hypothetical protein